MKNIAICIVLFSALAQVTLAQFKNELFLNEYHFYKKNQPKKAVDYKDIEGNPYLTREFIKGIIYLKDTTAVKLPLRYNIFTDEIEFRHEENNFIVGSPQSINKVELGESVFVYLPFSEKPGYFEVCESGKSFLVRKKVVTFKPAEGPKAIEGVIPARFIRESDVFFIVNDDHVVKISNLKSVKTAFSDKTEIITEFIKKERIKNARKDNLLSIVKYYNSL